MDPGALQRRCPRDNEMWKFRWTSEEKGRRPQTRRGPHGTGNEASFNSGPFGRSLFVSLSRKFGSPIFQSIWFGRRPHSLVLVPRSLSGFAIGESVQQVEVEEGGVPTK